MRTTALLGAAAAYAVDAASSSSSVSAPPSSASAPSPPMSSSSTTLAPDSVYATSGFDALSPLNRVALLATIVVFFLLSVLSGRELWRLRYGRSSSSASSSPPLSSSAATASAALQPKPHGGGNSYTTPRHHSYGGVPTPQSATAAVSTHPSSSFSATAGGGDVSTGAEMRERLFVLLFAASTIRVVSLIVEITTLRAMAASPAASLYARLLSMFLWLPALLFVSMYGLVLLFWAQLCYACLGKFHPWPRRLFFAFNVLLYVVFVVLLVATSTSGAFWRACDLTLGTVYAIGLGAMLFYSARLIHFFRTHGPDDDFFFDRASSTTSPRQIVLRRITVVCVLLSVLFAAKASYLLALGVGFVPSEETQYRSPEGVHHLAFEFAIHFFTEFVPCAMLLIVTRKQATPTLPTTAAIIETGNTAPGLLLPTHGIGGGFTPGMQCGLRGRNNSAFNDDNHSVGSGSLTGYQFQAVQRTYGAALTNALRATGTPGTNTGGPFQATETASAAQPPYV